MDEARRAVEGGQTLPFILLADVQTEGRGRIEGRRWEAGPGSSLTMTLCLEPSASLKPALSLRVGLGAARRLALFESLAGRIALKWPNDILGLDRLEGRWKKLGGILCESSGSGLYVGIGLNLKSEAYGPALDEKATSLETLLSASNIGIHSLPVPRLEDLAHEIGNAVIESLSDLDWREKYLALLWGLGQELRFKAGDPRSSHDGSGILVDIEEDGSIVLLEQGKNRRRYHSGEISGLAGH